mgnify:CR=1 FL=1
MQSNTPIKGSCWARVNEFIAKIENCVPFSIWRIKLFYHTAKLCKSNRVVGVNYKVVRNILLYLSYFEYVCNSLFRSILFDSGLYCETVIKSGKQLLVPDALADKDWENNPDVELNMISYLGFPILFPDGNPFGTICVLDNKKNAY